MRTHDDLRLVAALEESTRDAQCRDEDDYDYRMRLAMTLSAATTRPGADAAARQVLRALSPFMNTFVLENCVTFGHDDAENERSAFAQYQDIVDAHLGQLLLEASLSMCELATVLTHSLLEPHALLEDEDLLVAVSEFGIFQDMMRRRNAELHAAARQQIGYYAAPPPEPDARSAPTDEPDVVYSYSAPTDEPDGVPDEASTAPPSLVDELPATRDVVSDHPVACAAAETSTQVDAALVRTGGSELGVQVACAAAETGTQVDARRTSELGTQAEVPRADDGRALVHVCSLARQLEEARAALSRSQGEKDALAADLAAAREREGQRRALDVFANGAARDLMAEQRKEAESRWAANRAQRAQQAAAIADRRARLAHESSVLAAQSPTILRGA